MSVLILTVLSAEAPSPSNDLSTLPESIVEASSTLGLKSNTSLKSKLSPVTSDV